MACYWIARAKINDPVAYKRYTDEVPGILKKYGGKALSRGAAFETLEGPNYSSVTSSSSLNRWRRRSAASTRRNTWRRPPIGVRGRGRTN